MITGKRVLGLIIIFFVLGGLGSMSEGDAWTILGALWFDVQFTSIATLEVLSFWLGIRMLIRNEPKIPFGLILLFIPIGALISFPVAADAGLDWTFIPAAWFTIKFTVICLISALVLWRGIKLMGIDS